MTSRPPDTNERHILKGGESCKVAIELSPLGQLSLGGLLQISQLASARGTKDRPANPAKTVLALAEGRRPMRPKASRKKRGK